MENDRLKKQLDFCLEIDREKFIQRQTYLTDGIRRENDAEHAWHAALMAILLEEYSNEPIDLLKTVTMLLIHDIVEIDAGDTYAYDETAKSTQSEREEKASERIFGLLPENQRRKFCQLWKEFESGDTPESRFAHVMDNLQPMMLNAATDGKAWEEHKVRIDQILGRNRHTSDGSEVLWNYAYLHWILDNVKAGKILTPDHA